MSGQLPSSPNLRHLKNQAKRLLKQWLAGEPAALQELRLLHPSFELLSSEQLATRMCLHNAQLALARRYGFQNWPDLCARVAIMTHVDLSALTPDQAACLLTGSDDSVAISVRGSAAVQAEKLAKYERGRPYRENGTLYISEKRGLTLEEALNDTARIHDMPPVGTRYTSAHCIEWTIEDYAYFVAPTTMARYPNDCDYLPIVKPHNISQRLLKLLCEVDHCTSKCVLLLDTMPAVHPFGLGKNTHCANMNADPTEVRIPQTRREPLIYSLQIAGAVLEQKRWPRKLQEQLVGMLELFEAATPEIYATAMELVNIVNRRPLDTRAALRTALDECTILGFRFTDGDFDIGRDLEEVTPTECMQGKFPNELVGFPVPLKLEVGKARARLGIDGCETINVSTAPSGMAMVIFTGDDGRTIGPIQVNYRMAPPEWLIDQERERAAREQRRLSAKRTPVDPRAPYRHIPMIERPRIKGMIPDDYGRLPGENGYNTSYPPGQDPFSLMNAANAHLNGGSGAQSKLGELWSGSATSADQYGRMPGDPGYMMPFPPGHPAMPQPNNPVRSNRTEQAPGGPPVFPWLDTNRNYMAGLTRSVAEARLAQQMGMHSPNLYVYAENNPASYIDPSGRDTIPWTPPWLAPTGPHSAEVLKCLSDAVKGNPDCQKTGKANSELYAIMRCIIGCENRNEPGRTNPWTPDYAPNTTTPSTDPRYGIGPCRISGPNHTDLTPGFPGWKDHYCQNIRLGVAILCQRGKLNIGQWGTYSNKTERARCFTPCMKEQGFDY